MAPSPQAGFASALRDPTFVAPRPEARFAIYRNNRHAALTEALAATFAATARIVGEAFFRTMAHAFVAAHPPHSPVLLEYGAEFPAFVDGFEAASELAYLSDVARIEWAWMCAYHAADVCPLDATALGARDDEEIASLRFTLHPSLALIRSAHPAATIWRMNTDGGEPGPIESWDGESILVARPKLDVLVRIIPQDTIAFLAALAAGLPLDLAAEAAACANPGFDLPAQLATGFALGLIVAISPNSTETPS